MTTDSPILFDRHGAIASIRFNRPAALNAIDHSMAQRFLEICRSLTEASDIRVVVLSGEGKAFMAGGDLARFHDYKARAAQTAEQIITPLHEALAMLTALPQPVVASLHGAVAGAGVSLALACDLCIAAADTQFNLAYARIGTSPDASVTWSLPRIVGMRRAMELTLLAESFDAAEAQRLGIVNRVVPAASLVEETLVLSQRLAAGPSYAYGQIKRLIRSSFGQDMQQQMDAERAAFCACAGTGDFAEGVDAFFDKRRPDFQGR